MSIFVITGIFLALGTVMVYSSSAIYAYENMGDSLLFLKRHVLFLALSIAGAVCFMSFDYRKLKKYSRGILMICLALLVFVAIPGLGSKAGGARRWFRFGAFSFQPSEMAKLGLIIYLADFLSRKKPYINKFLQVLLPVLAVAGATGGLILLQPDLGTAVVIAFFTLILLFSAGLRWSYILGSFAAAFPLFYFLIVKVPYRWRRVKIFLNPWQDARGTGFQLVQSFLALGSGGIFGAGLGMSKQKLFYLPEGHTDFIFSIIGEELGLIGTLSVTLLFAAFFWQGMRLVFKVEDPFGSFLALGIVSMIALEVIINIGVSIGALPTKGLPLPFISYGGSALFFHMIATGLLLNVAKNHNRL